MTRGETRWSLSRGMCLARGGEPIWGSFLLLLGLGGVATLPSHFFCDDTVAWGVMLVNLRGRAFIGYNIQICDPSTVLIQFYTVCHQEAIELIDAPCP